MQLNAYLNFNGQCEAAFKFYEQVLGGKILFMQTWGNSPGCDMMPADSQNLIMHATLSVGETRLMGADVPPGNYQKPAGISVSIHVKDKAEGEGIFNALAENGNTVMPFQPTFWAAGFGICVDQFGIPWMVNCEAAAATA